MRHTRGVRSLVNAWREVRLRPARYLSTLAAIVLAIGYLAATQTAAATESDAIAKRQVLFASHADVIVESHLWHATIARKQREQGLVAAETALQAQSGVAAVERFGQLYATLVNGDRAAGVMLSSSPEHQQLRWYQPVAGRLPSGPDEIVLTEQTARDLGARLGDPITLAGSLKRTLTVVGLTDQRGYADSPAYASMDLIEAIDATFPPPDSRILVNPDSFRSTTPGSSGDGVGIWLLVALDDQARAAEVAAATQQSLTDQGFLKVVVQARTAADVRAQAVREQAAGSDWLSVVLGGSGLVALAVGTLMIANTFAILMAQRRRQLGLLRVVGASRGQVLRRNLAEAVLLGIGGVLIGVPVGIAAAWLIARHVTGSLEFGLIVPWWRLGLITAAGVLATVLAALLPLLRATAVVPLEALRPAETEGGAHRRAGVRLAVCGGLALVGAAAVGWGLTGSPDGAITRVGLGVAAIAVAVLTSVSVLVPGIFAAIGRLPLQFRPVARLALANTARNPGRVGAMVAALLVAVGLIVTVQVAAATGLAGALAQVDERYPVDLTLQSAVQEADLSDPNGGGPPGHREGTMLAGFKPGALDLVRKAPGIADAGSYGVTEPVIVLAGPGLFAQLPVTTLPADADRLFSRPVTVGPGEIGLPSDVMTGLRLAPGAPVQVLPVLGNRQDLLAVEANLGASVAIVDASTMKALDMTTRDGLILARLDDPSAGGTAVEQVTAGLLPEHPGLTVGGGAPQKTQVRLLLDGVSLTLTGLLAVAVLVAVIGVGNTLGLAVVERTRESALLRAMGLQRSSLRLTLLLEAVLLSVVSVLLSLGLGAFFGWAGASAVLRQLGYPATGMQLDWTLTLGTCAAVIVAAALASVLPGRRAALASPVAAMADLG